MYYCGSRILAHVLSLDGELDFYLKNDLIFKKMTWSHHLFLFYFLKQDYGPHISTHVLPLDGELDFYLKNDFIY